MKINNPVHKLMLFIGIFGLFLIFGGGKTNAVAGAPSNLFPDATYRGTGDTYAIVQVTGQNHPSANLKMKARTTLANIYVPKTKINQTISMTIVGGCDGTTRDVGASAGSTLFRVYNDSTKTTLASKSNSSGCVSGDLALTFVATDVNPGDIDNMLEGYNLYVFIADGVMTEAGSVDRYLNAFQVQANTAGVLVGISDKKWPCNKSAYPMSCPAPRPGETQSTVYSSFYGPYGQSPWGMKIDVVNTCSTKGGISLYDLDAGGSFTDTQNLSIKLLRNGASTYVTALNGTQLNSLPDAAIQNWDVGMAGLLRAHSPYGGKNNQFMDIPGGDPMFTGFSQFDANVPYTFIIDGISKDNAIQMTADLDHCQDDTGDCQSVTLANMPTNPFPANTYKVTIKIKNTGSKTWVPGQWNLRYNGSSASGTPGYTNNYLTNGTSNTGTVPWAAGSTNVGPNGIATFEDEFTVPAAVEGKEYPFQFKLEHTGVGYMPESLCDQPFGVGQGRLFDTFDTTKNRQGIIDSCYYGTTRTSDTNGQFTFVANKASTFCVHLLDLTSPGIDTQDRINVYPYGEGYTVATNDQVCAAGTWCSGVPVYNCQIMLSTTTSTCGGKLVRQSQRGLDLSVSWAPVVTCAVNASNTEIGSTVTYTMSVNNNTRTNKGAIPDIYGTATVSLNPTTGVSSATASNSTLTAAAPLGYGTTKTLTMTPNITFTASNTYTVTGSMPWTGGGYSATATCAPDTTAVVDSPYLRVYGGDVLAGSGFGDSCSNVTADVKSYAKQVTTPTTGWVGAGTQLGAIVSGTLNQFLTHDLVSTNTPLARSFANTGPNGGAFGSTLCAYDFWANSAPKAVTSSATTVDISTLPSGKHRFPANTTLTASAPLTTQLSIFVNGHVIIGSDLKQTTSWANVQSIPSLYIVSKGGNVLIRPVAHQIDGILVAEPADLNNVNDPYGKIYTCVSDTGIASPTVAQQAPGGNCNSGLLINGALVAKKINFLRTRGSLSSATIGEKYTSSNIAEIIRYIPDTFMSTPSLIPEFSIDAFDSVVSLPPSL